MLCCDDELTDIFWSTIGVVNRRTTSIDKIIKTTALPLVPCLSADAVATTERTKTIKLLP